MEQNKRARLENVRVDGITDFERGQRDFAPSAPSNTDSTAIRADFTSAEKEYTNGVLAARLGLLKLH